MLVTARRWYVNAFKGLEQGCTNRGFQIAVTTEFFTMAPDVYGFSVYLCSIQLLGRFSRNQSPVWHAASWASS
jgi:hypothetical protein